MPRRETDVMTILEKRRAKKIQDNEELRAKKIYDDTVAKLLQNAQNEDDFEKAAAAFKGISAYKNAAQLAEKCLSGAEYIRREKEACRLRLQREAEAARNEKLKKQRRRKKLKYTLLITAGLIAACAALVFTVLLPMVNYDNAVELAAEGETAKAAIAFGKARNYKDARERSFELWDTLAVRDTIACIDGFHGSAVVGLKPNGEVMAAGTEAITEFTESMQELIAVSGGDGHIVGLKADGTAVARGYTGGDYRCDVHRWKNIVAISANDHTFGLKADGTVVVKGNRKSEKSKVLAWRDIIAISAGGTHTVGLKADGTVVAAGSGDNGACNVADWQDIVAISAGGSHTVGLKADGTVIAAGSNEHGQCNVTEWKDILAISAGSTHTVGLKADGTVVATNVMDEYYDYGQHAVFHWNNIIAVFTGSKYSVGLKSDGTAIITEIFYNNRYDYNKDNGYKELSSVSEWSGIILPQ